MTYRGLHPLLGPIRTLLTANALSLDVSLLMRSGVQLGTVHAGVVGAHSAKSTGEGAVTRAGALHGKCLAHDGATLAEHLEV